MIFLLITGIVYYIDHKLYIKDLRGGIIEYKSGELHITPNLKARRYSFGVLIIGVISFFIFISVVIWFYLGGIEAIITILILWIILTPVIIFSGWVISVASKKENKEHQM